ncbi:MAG: response regulator transcription factor [Bacillota bacterium]
MQQRILIIEDDLAIQKGLETSLTAEGYNVTTAEDGQKGYSLAEKNDFSLIILDLMLPYKNGLDICRDLRSRGIATPVIMLTSKKDEIDKVVGLEIGADDYLTKPFSIRELNARIKAVLRRVARPEKEMNCYKFGSITVDFNLHEVHKHNKLLDLTVKEFNLLKFFIEHEGQIITRNQLLDEVWGYDAFPTTRTVDNYVLALRKKIENDPSSPDHIMTIYTAGYKFIK